MKSFRALRHLPRDLWIVCFAILVNRTGQMALPFLMLYLTDARGFAAPEAGDVFIAYGIASIGMAPLAGRLADRFGPMRVMSVSQVLTGLAMFLVPHLHSRVALFAGVIAWAVCAESFRPGSMTAIGTLAPPDQRAPAFALARTAVNLGISVGALAGGWLSESHFDAIFYVNGTGCILTACVLVPLASRERADARAKAAASVGAGTTAVPAAHRLDPRLAWLCASVFCIALVFFQFDSTMPLFLTRDLGQPKRMFGVLLDVNTVLIVLVEVPLNAMVAKWPLMRTLSLSSLLIAIGFGAFALVHGFAGAAVATIVWTFGEMLCFPAQNAFVTSLAPEGRTGRAMGWYLFVFNIAFSIGPAVGTRIYAAHGARALWVGCFGLGLVATWLMRRATRVRVQDAN